MSDYMRIETALVSVSDRSGLAEFCEGLSAIGVQIIATDSTGVFLRDHDVPSMPVAQVTGSPEMLDGRVKTLHPRIHGAILADRNNPDHMRQLRELRMTPIDLVVVNLYPFRDAVARDLPWEQVIENIDIGGPAMVRASAKNHSSVAVVTNPVRYHAVLEEIQHNGGLSADTRRSLAAEAFAMTGAYDAAIARWMTREEAMPQRIVIPLERIQDLRYGENPHQVGALYADVDERTGTLARARQVQGKELSYNNILDLDAAWAVANDYDEPACAIIKHAIPCGIGVGADIAVAYERALESDRVSAFGGVVAVNRPLTREAAERITAIFTECVAAPSIDADALEVFAVKQNIRLLEVGDWHAPELAARHVSGGFLVQSADASADPRADMRVVSKSQPTEEQWTDLLFAWRAVKHVRSNAIVFARDGATVGIGGGQTSRVDAVEIAARKAGDRAKGAVMASDAFFPFRDGIDAGATAGIAAVIQPGGSVRDEEVIAACDEHGIAMIVTGVRHFRHG